MRGFAFCNELYGDLPLPRVLEKLASLGYHGVELDPRSLEGLDSGWVAESCARLGIRVAGLHWLLAGQDDLHLTHPSAGVRRATLLRLTHLTALCARLGGEVMVLGGAKKRRVMAGVALDQALGYTAELLTELGESLVKYDVRLGLEPLPQAVDNLLTTAGAAAEMVNRVGCPNIGLTLDARAMGTEALPREFLIAAHFPQLVHVHVNDDSGSGPGMGDTDLVPMLSALRERGYQGWVSVEAFDPSPDPQTVAARSLDYLRSKL